MIQKIELVTLTDARRFVDIVSSLEGDIRLIDGKGYVINGKSILGAMAALEWSTLYVMSEHDIYNKIREFAVK